jgi:hypothetical protein
MPCGRLLLLLLLLAMLGRDLHCRQLQPAAMGASASTKSPT